MSLDLKDLIRTDYVKKYFNRNKKIFTVSLIIFILFGAIGAFNFNINYAEDTGADQNDEPLTRETLYNNLNEDNTFIGFINLFWHNFSIDFQSITGGLMISIPSLFAAYINASEFGSIIAELDFITLLLGILPHGIFEIPSSMFALAGAFMLTSFEFKLVKGIISSKTTVKGEINSSLYLVKDAVITTGIVFILLIIAAFIETFVTPILLGLTI